ncbi:MAG TPA: GAF domain-containing protein [Rhodanobacteraceae bacterium]|jgi:PAS domain S-box-containing protein
MGDMASGWQRLLRSSRNIGQADEISWRGLIERSQDGVMVVGEEGRVCYVNPAAAALLGWTAEQLVGSMFGYPLCEGAPTQVEIARANAPALVVEMRMARTNWNESPAWFVSLQDITERKRVAALEKERVALLATMAEGASLQEVLDATVRLIESQHRQAICTVLLLDEEGLHLRHAASGGFPSELVHAIEHARIGPGQGCCGTAAHEGRTVISADIASDPNWLDWRDQMLRYGLRACWSVPIFSSAQRVLGTVAVYYRTAWTPSQAELELAAACVQIVGIAIEKRDSDQQVRALELGRRRMLEQLQASEAQYRLLFEGNPHPMWVFDRESLRFLAVNDAAVRHYGYAREEFLAMSVLDLRPEEDFARFSKVVRLPTHRQKDPALWRHKRRDGSLIDVEIVSDDIVFDGRSGRLVLVSDITARLAAERELARISRAQAMLGRCNEAVIHAAQRQTLLDAVCRIVVETGGYRMAWIGFADPQGAVRPEAWAGAGLEYLKDLRLSSSENEIAGRGPGGRTLRSGKPVVVQDIQQQDSGFAWKMDSARANNLRKAITLPLRDGQQTIGLLCLYSPDTSPVASEELLLLESLADNITWAALHLNGGVEIV